MMSDSIKALLKEGLAHHLDGRRIDAASRYRRILDLEPSHTDALHLLGLLAQQEGAYEEALSHIRRAVALAPEFAQYRVNLGVVLREVGRLDEAIDQISRAVELDPTLPEGHYNLGHALLANGEDGAALTAFQRAVSLRPNYAEALMHIAHILKTRGETDLSLAYLERAVGHAADYAPARINLCAAYAETGRLEEAITCGKVAAELAPGDPDAHYNLGNAYSAADEPSAAEVCYRAALDLAPEHADAWCNLGVSLLADGKPQAATEALDRALSLEPELADANWNMALALLTLGRFEAGWALYDWRWRAVPWLERRQFEQPEWDGRPLNGEVVLVHSEQGYGDTLQFARYLPEVRRRGARIRLACQPALKRFLSALPDIESVTGYGEPPGDFDLHLPIMSLPGVVGADPESEAPSVEPYLPLPQTFHDDIAAEVLPKVGVVWRGSTVNVRGMFRSCTLEDIAPVFDCEDVRFYALQTDTDVQEAERLDGYGVVDLSGRISDFADSAALTAQMDLIITIDTAQAHLAGGLGIPVWALLAKAADWRWLLERADSPWYPQMRLFRQAEHGDWRSPVREVVANLPQFLGELSA